MARQSTFVACPAQSTECALGYDLAIKNFNYAAAPPDRTQPIRKYDCGLPWADVRFGLQEEEAPALIAPSRGALNSL